MAAIEPTRLSIWHRASSSGQFAQTPNHSSGFLAGGQLWLQSQLSNHVVVGLETDAQWSA